MTLRLMKSNGVINRPACGCEVIGWKKLTAGKTAFFKKPKAMKNILLFIAIVLLASCSSQRYCQPSKRSKDWAVLKEGTISKDHEKTTLIKISRTQFGFKHLFISDQGDTIYKTYQQRLCVGECYYLLKG